MKKIISTFLIMCIMAACFSGCRVGDTNVYVSTTSPESDAFMIGQVKCSKKEATLYYACFKDYFGELGGVSDSAMSLLCKVYSLNLYGEDNEMELEEQEKDRARFAAQDFMTKVNKDQLKAMDISESDIRSYYERYTQALKIYNYITKQVDSEVSEDESRVMDAYVISLSNDEKCGEIDERLAAGDDFATLVQVYSEKEKRITSFGRGTYAPEMDEVVFNLDDGQVSGRIDCSQGIYYVKCENKFNQEKSTANKQTIIEKRQKALITNIINEQSEIYYSSVNDEFFKELETNIPQLDGGSEFFKTIEGYLE